MNVGEMHIAIQQGVDKINSFQADMLLPEEIDLELNQAQGKFINTKYGKGNKFQKGFEQSQKRIDDIRTLVDEILLPATYKEQLDTNVWVDTVRLPDDYMHLVNTRAHVWHNSNCAPMKEDTDWETSTINNYLYFELPMSSLMNTTLADSVAGIYVTPDISGMVSTTTFPPFFISGAATIFDNNVTALSSSISDPAGMISFRSHMETGVALNWWGHWENFLSVTSPGNILLRLWPATYPLANCDPTLGVVWSVVAVDSVGKVLHTDLLKCEAGLDITRSLMSSDDGVVLNKKSSKFVQQDDIFTMLKDPFNTTTLENPLYTIRDNKLDLYTNDIFIIEEVKLTYIRKPAEISLSLQVSCELPEHSHREIVDMAVSSILESIADPRYKTHEIEVNKNE